VSAVGVSVVRADGAAKVTGQAIYGADFGLAGMRFGALLRSPVPFGRIVRLDTGPAAAMPGVRAVITAADAPRTRAGWVIRDHELFASDTVRFEGEPIAAVVADSLALARAAVLSIVLEIEEQRGVYTVEESLAEGAPLVHPDWESYVSMVGDFPRSGNVAAETVSNQDPTAVDAAFARAFRVVEGRYSVQRQYQGYLEPKNATVTIEDGRYVCHASTQYPFNVRDRVAQFLGLGSSAVRVVAHHTGGGFGGRLDAALEPYAALLAKACGSPVHMVNTRTEDLITCGSRDNAVVTIRSALDKNGEVIARELDCVMDNGAFSGEMPLLTSIAVHMAGSTYRVGPCRIRCRLVYTNTAPTGAFRGINGNYLCLAVERHTDSIADALGIDRRQYRLDHLIDSGVEMINGQVLPDAHILREAFDAVEAHAPWPGSSRGSRRIDTPGGERLRGVSLVSTWWLTNPLPGAATIKMNEDGTVGLVTGAMDNGSGAVHTGLVQIVADTVGVSPDAVIVSPPDTDINAYDAGAQGSRTTHVVGRACRDAALAVRARLVEQAARMFEADAADIDIVDGRVSVKGVPSQSLALGDVVITANFGTGPLQESASYTTPPVPYNPACGSGMMFGAFTTPTFHVHYAVVDVDPTTGLVDVVRYVVAQEVGKAINPAAVRGQIQGGVVQGLGYALSESLRLVDGRFLERTLESYRLPLAVDVPDVEVIVLEHPDQAGPFGAKGVAEPSIIPVAAAIANAVSDAIGSPLDDVPLTPEVILDAIERREADTAAATAGTGR
jgi:CO/xanthine dehydrogenase Mo-binding subunit